MRRPAAFTLLEVLIAIALVASLVGSMLAFLMNMMQARERARLVMERGRTAAVLFQRLERDLACCVVGDGTGGGAGTGTGGGTGGGTGAGVAGSAQQLRVLTRAVPVALAERGADDPRVLADLEACEYRFSEEKGELEVRRQVVGFDASDELVPIGGAALVRFRFHDGERWVERFDSLQAKRLPHALEVAIWFESPWLDDSIVPEPAAEKPDELPPSEAAVAPDESTGAGALASSDRNLRPPDRMRVIIVPDPAEGGADE